MEPLEVHAIVEKVGGEWRAPVPPPPLRVAELSTDSRTIARQSVFVALDGPRFDGHDYLEEARRKGAVASIVRRSRLGDLPRAGGPYIAVDDPLAALERIAAWNRDHLALTVIGVTGSVGKTSTKEFLQTLLSGAFRVKSAPKSYNNRLGVAATLLSAGPSTEVLVVELGTSEPGDLAHLSGIVRPDKVVLTEVAPAHLDGLGDLDGVVAAKAEIFGGLKTGGTTFLRHGVEGFERFAALSSGPIVTFGWGSGDYAVTDCQRVSLGQNSKAGGGWTDYGYHFTLNEKENFLLPVAGRHNVINAAAAIAVARDLGMSWEETRCSLANCRLPPLRLQVAEENGVVFVDDTYNANPLSMKAAISEWQALRETHNGTQQNGHSSMVAVLGDMLEMGSESRRLHQQVGTLLVGAGARLIVTIGSDSRWIGEAYSDEASMAGGATAEAVHFSSVEEATRFLRQKLCVGDHVLFKASRGMGLDRVVRDLRQWALESLRTGAPCSMPHPGPTS